jgi:hypothetical protein
MFVVQGWSLAVEAEMWLFRGNGVTELVLLGVPFVSLGCLFEGSDLGAWPWWVRNPKQKSELLQHAPVSKCLSVFKLQAAMRDRDSELARGWVATCMEASMWLGRLDPQGWANQWTITWG